MLIKKGFPYSHWELLDAETGDRLRIVPERGGLITEWRCKNREILYFDQERFKEHSKSIRGGIPVLFPICGNLTDDSVILLGKKVSIPQHGFARDSSWQMSPLDNTLGFRLSLSDNENTFRIYPYNFLLEMEVSLGNNCINFNIIISNLGENKLPFSFGLHPYFRVKDLKNINIEGLHPMCMNHLNLSSTVTKSELSRLEEGVDFLCGPTGLVTLLDIVEARSLQVQFEQPMDLAVIWTDPPRKMVCIEPWTSQRNSLISGDRLQFVEPGSKQKLKCTFLSF